MRTAITITIMTAATMIAAVPMKVVWITVGSTINQAAIKDGWTTRGAATTVPAVIRAEWMTQVECMISPVAIWVELMLTADTMTDRVVTWDEKIQTDVSTTTPVATKVRFVNLTIEAP